MVILDELGRGTSTFDGTAIAHSVVHHLVTQTKCRALFATHYHALTREFEVPNPKVALYHMACAVDEASRDVTFLYQFAKGASHRSHGVSVAKLAGLPSSVLDLAASKSKELEATLDGKYALQLARRVLGAAAAAAERPPSGGGGGGGGGGVVGLWREAHAVAAELGGRAGAEA